MGKLNTVVGGCCGVKTSQEQGSSFVIFRSTEKAQLLAITITEQPIQITRLIVRVINFLIIFAKSGHSKRSTRSRPFRN